MKYLIFALLAAVMLLPLGAVASHIVDDGDNDLISAMGGDRDC